MAKASNPLRPLILTSLLALTFSFPQPALTSRQIITYKLNLLARLKLDGKSSYCWDSLVRLNTCTNEVIVVFINGPSYLGQSCCGAIRTIEYQCWPGLLSSIGFFPDEVDILRYYCYAANQLESQPKVGP